MVVGGSIIPQPQHPEEMEGGGGRGRIQMAPGPFAAEKLTNTKRLASLPPSLFVRCLVPLISI